MATKMLIRTYGLYWNPEAVNWERKIGEVMLGSLKVGEKTYTRNFWLQTGVYVLYKDYVPVYVGMTVDSKNGIGERLKVHRDSRTKKGTWDAFSWFGLRDINTSSDSLQNIGSGGKQVNADQIASAVEAILIEVIRPPLNRRSEFPRATLVEQVDAPKHSKTDEDK